MGFVPTVSCYCYVPSRRLAAESGAMLRLRWVDGLWCNSINHLQVILLNFEDVFDGDPTLYTWRWVLGSLANERISGSAIINDVTVTAVMPPYVCSKGKKEYLELWCTKAGVESLACQIQIVYSNNTVYCCVDQVSSSESSSFSHSYSSESSSSQSVTNLSSLSSRSNSSSSSSSYIQRWSSSSSSLSTTSLSSQTSISSLSSQSTSSWAAMAALSGSGGPVAANQNYEIQGTFGGKDWYRTQDTLYSIWWDVTGSEWIVSNSPPDPALGVWWFSRSNASPFGGYTPINGTGNPVLVDLFASSSSVSDPSSSISTPSSPSSPSSVSSVSSISSSSESTPSSESRSSSVIDLWSSSSIDLLHCTGNGVPAPNGTYREAFIVDLFYTGVEAGIVHFRIYDAGGTWILRDFISDARWQNGAAGTPIGTYSPLSGGATGNPVVAQV